MASDDDGQPSEVELNGREVTDEVLATLTAETGYSFDVDARWGYRTRTYDNRTNKVFGYKLVSLTRLAPQDSKADLPLLVERISLVPANRSTVAPALGLIDNLLAGGTPVTELADDRGFSYALPEHWAAAAASSRSATCTRTTAGCTTSRASRCSTAGRTAR